MCAKKLLLFAMFGKQLAISPHLLNGPDFILMPPLSLWQRKIYNYGSGRQTKS